MGKKKVKKISDLAFFYKIRKQMPDPSEAHSLKNKYNKSKFKKEEKEFNKTYKGKSFFESDDE